MASSFIEAFKFFFIFSFSLGLWTVINLIVTRRNDPYVRGALIIYIFLLLNAPINAYFSLIRAEPIGFLVAIGQNISWIYGPLLAILINRLLLIKTHTFNRTLNFIPFVLFTANQVFQLFHIPFWQYVVLLYLQMGCHLGCALTNAFKHRKQLAKLKTNYRHGSYYWAMHLSFGLGILMLWDLTIVSGLYLGLINSLMFTTVLGCAFSIYISALALLFIYQPQISHQATPETTPDTPTPVIHLVRSIELSEQAASELQIKLEKLIKTHQPHHDPDISLELISKMPK
ncbi:MAG TPA: hypothetical protein VIZ65_09310 [Cellvibrionaceae bacterium]